MVKHNILKRKIYLLIMSIQTNKKILESVLNTQHFRSKEKTLDISSRAMSSRKHIYTHMCVLNADIYCGSCLPFSSLSLSLSLALDSSLSGIVSDNNFSYCSALLRCWRVCVCMFVGQCASNFNVSLVIVWCHFRRLYACYL